MVSLTIESCREVISSDQTNDLTLWPLLRSIPESFLRHVEKFFLYNDRHLALFQIRSDIGAEPRFYSISSIDWYGRDRLGLQAEPIELVELRGKTLVQFNEGGSFVMVITSQGDLYGWGSNNMGELGSGSELIQDRPVLVLSQVKSVVCGTFHTIALRLDGTVWSWGYNQGGALGHLSLAPPKCLRRPLQVNGVLRGQNVVLISGYSYTTVALTDQARFFYWGGRVYYPREVILPTSLKSIVSMIPSSNELLMHTPEGSVYRCDQSKSNFSFTQIDLGEPVIAMINPGQFCLKLQSGRVVIWSKDRVTRLGLTSLADTCALYFSHSMPGWINLSPQALEMRNQPNLKYFNHLPTSNFALCFDHHKIYLNTQVASQRSLYWARQLEHGLRNKTEGRVDGLFVTWFACLRYVFTGQLSLIEPDWIGELLALATDTETDVLRDHCLHLITTHMPTTIHRLVQSEIDWSTVVDQLYFSFDMANAAYYFKMAELIQDETLHNDLLILLANRSLSSARQILDQLETLAGKSNQIHQSDEPPEQYLEWIISHSDHAALVKLLQDPLEGPHYTRHISASLTRENCVRYFRVACHVKKHKLKETIWQFASRQTDSKAICDEIIAIREEAEKLARLAAAKRRRKRLNWVNCEPRRSPRVAGRIHAL